MLVIQYLKNKGGGGLGDRIVGLISIITTIIQFFGYGLGFLKSYLKITLNPNKKVQEKHHIVCLSRSCCSNIQNKE